eukprot:jgi/Bigna1/82653/fgenesh1_pg.95_\
MSRVISGNTSDVKRCHFAHFTPWNIFPIGQCDCKNCIVAESKNIVMGQFKGIHRHLKKVFPYIQPSLLYLRGWRRKWSALSPEKGPVICQSNVDLTSKTCPFVPGSPRPRKLLAAGGTEAQVTSILERDTRYKFLKTRQSQFSRFIKALRELLSHYSKTIRTFMKTHEHLREENTNGKSFKQKLTSCKKTYETAIEQLLEKAYHEAKEEAITTRIAAFSSQDGGEASPPRLMTSSRSTRQANSASCSSSVSSSSRNGCEHGKRLNFKREQVYYLSKWFENMRRFSIVVFDICIKKLSRLVSTKNVGAC